MSELFARAEAVAQFATLVVMRGVVTDVRGIVVEATGPFVPVGMQVMITSGVKQIPAQVVGFRTDRVLLMPFHEMHGVSPGSVVEAFGEKSEVLVSDRLLGRVVNALGEPVDELPEVQGGEAVDLYRAPPSPVMRRRIDAPLELGVQAIDSFLTIGAGQRVGIMSGSGVGKSTLLGMIARNSASDINVIALVGERGREVREFIERDLGPEGLARSVIVVATGNESALLRIRAAFLATSIAEYFRDQGKSVLLMLDSVTRFAMAQREVGLAIGEPPSTKGYTPSVFSLLPKLLERAGTSEGKGLITALYTVLVEGDDMNEPIADAVRGILDGHIVLDRRLAGKGHYPAIDILQSVSRTINDICPPEHISNTNKARDLLALYRDNEDLLTIGAYKKGTSEKLDQAIEAQPKLVQYLKQASSAKSLITQSWAELAQIVAPSPK